MRGAILPLLVLLGGCAGAVPGGGGIVSTNPCADAMLVRLVPPDRIAAISHYSQDPGATSMPIDVARRFRATAGTAEEVIALNPDLVVTSSFTPPATRAAYVRAGLRVLLLDSPTSSAASKAQIRLLAAAVGAGQAGAAMVARIDTAIADAARSTPVVPLPTLLFIGGSLANGPGTLLDELMARAGLHNTARDLGMAYSSTVSAEALVGHPPALVLAPDPASRSARARAAALGNRTRMARFPRSFMNCGGPTIIPALARLRAIRRDAS